MNERDEYKSETTIVGRLQYPQHRFTATKQRTMNTSCTDCLNDIVPLSSGSSEGCWYLEGTDPAAGGAEGCAPAPDAAATPGSSGCASSTWSDSNCLTGPLRVVERNTRLSRLLPMMMDNELQSRTEGGERNSHRSVIAMVTSE